MTCSPNTSIFMKKWFFDCFKSQISKWKHMSELLSKARGLKDSYSLSNKQQKNVSSHGSPCTFQIKSFANFKMSIYKRKFP